MASRKRIAKFKDARDPDAEVLTMEVHILRDVVLISKTDWDYLEKWLATVGLELTENIISQGTPKRPRGRPRNPTEAVLLEEENKNPIDNAA